MVVKVGHDLIASISNLFHQMLLKNSPAPEDSSSVYLRLWTRLRQALARPFCLAGKKLVRYLHVDRHWVFIFLRGLGISIGVVLATVVAYKVVKFTYRWSLLWKRERKEQRRRQQEREREEMDRFLERELERNSRLEIERQASIQREAQEQPPRPDPDRYPTCAHLRVITTSVSTQRPPPPSHLKLYIEHSQNAQAKQMHEGNSKLSQCWGVIIAGLSNTQVSPASVPESTIDSITLREIWDYGDDTLLVLLITLARQVGLEKVAEVHMQPLL